MSLLAFIPLVGISLVYIPASLYFILIGKVGTGISLFIYCTVVSLIVEKGFKPKFIGKRVGISSLLVLFYIIGGMSAFGMAGIFYGPLLCTIFLTSVALYHEKYDEPVGEL
jgi:predicted PurR-regulated permease PerM